MIVTFILSALMSIIIFIFSLFTLPALPLSMLNAITNLFSFMAIPIGVLKNYIGADYFTFLLVLIITYISLSPIIYISIWLYKRIKG